MSLNLPRIAPFLFVLLWSTGFVGAKYGLPYAEPFTFLALRLVIATVLLLGLGLVVKESKKMRPEHYWHAAVVGFLLHGAYLSGVFYAIHMGMPAGMTAVIVGLQPILSTLMARYTLKEQGSLLQWIGLILGFLGVVMVVSQKIHADVPPVAYLAAGIALIGTTAGTLYQKRFGAGMPLVTGTAVQYAATSLILIPLALLFETHQIQFTTEFWFALLWLVVVLSLGAIGLLLYLIQRTSTAQVTSLFYLVPPATAVEAFFLFHEKLNGLALLGMVVVALGVSLVIRPAPARPVQKQLQTE
ncbi:DMT family transporter [Deinococcus roseus]|uniref:Peptide ABC transporter ATP-binding protein n=1 Tax=Deinococcus roseus TaxID=392414 RepID=A0ABQ2CW66_9DEIO|nr:DMT family transporter [Deinococcus roseus]GGJ26423.1 peptide ABC transporter ATP-binding protein [Deinococcus roseus]